MKWTSWTPGPQHRSRWSVPALAALLVISVPDETVTHGVFSVAVAVHDSVRVCPFIRDLARFSASQITALPEQGKRALNFAVRKCFFLFFEKKKEFVNASVANKSFFLNRWPESRPSGSTPRRQVKANVSSAGERPGHGHRFMSICIQLRALIMNSSARN